MFGSWFAKAFLAFLLTFAIAGLAHGQTKSADLPVQQRISCAPVPVVATTQIAPLFESYWRSTPEPNNRQIDLAQVLTGTKWADVKDEWICYLRNRVETLPTFLTDSIPFLWNLPR